MHGKSFEPGHRHALGVGHVNISDVAAHVAYDMVMVVDVRIEARCSGSEVDLLKFAHGRQVGQCLVHRAQRDARHLSGGNLVERFRSGVSRVVVQQAKQQLPLGRDLQSSRTKGGDELFGGLHGFNTK